MKTIIAAGLLLPIAAHAVGIVSNPSRYVTASGSYVSPPLAENLPTEQASSTSSGIFNAIKMTGGSYGWAEGGFDSGSWLQVGAQASQSSSIYGGSFSFDSQVTTSFSTHNADGFAQAKSALDFDMTFAEPHLFDLTIAYSFSGSIPFFGDDGIILDGIGNYFYNADYGPTGGVHLTGTIAPGTYHYSVLMNHENELKGLGIAPDSQWFDERLKVDLLFSEVQGGQARLASNVPDYGSTALLLLLPLGLMFQFRGRFVSAFQIGQPRFSLIAMVSRLMPTSLAQSIKI